MLVIGFDIDLIKLCCDILRFVLYDQLEILKDVSGQCRQIKFFLFEMDWLTSHL